MESELITCDDGEAIEFVESYEPPIPAGEYLLTIAQELTEVNKKYTNTKKVLVKGERFSISPRDIWSVFPPDHNQGDHANVLPHVVFSRKTLPWERSSGIVDPKTLNQPKTTPWLALLIFDDDDPTPKARQLTVGDLFPSKLGPTTASYADARSSYSLEPDENLSDPCTVVDVPVDLFRAVVPSQEDLGWLAHSRTVSGASGHKAVVRTASLIGEDADAPTGEYSVMIANRLPKAGGVSTAYLVSLEGMANFLASDTIPVPDIKANGKNATDVRLVVLKQWSFTCTPSHETFKGFFDNLTYQPLQLPYGPSAPQSTAEDADVEKALAMGYTALNHNTRWGDQTISWYRGPFLPFSSAVPVTVPLPPISEDGSLTGATPISTADEALRYDPDLGMLDVSYAAAWQLGRLIAMRDKTFSYALYQWKHENSHKTYLHAHARAMQPYFDVLRALGGLKVDAEGARPHLLATASTSEVVKTVFSGLANPLLSVLQPLARSGEDTAK